MNTHYRGHRKGESLLPLVKSDQDALISLSQTRTPQQEPPLDRLCGVHALLAEEWILCL